MLSTAPPSVEGSIEDQSRPRPDAIGTAAISHVPDEMSNTLDEPVVTTIMRDLRVIGKKLKVVLLPGGTLRDSLPALPGAGGPGTAEAVITAQAQATLQALRDWDLFGPLLLCLLLSIILSINAPTGQTSLVFASVFCIVWLGAAIVTANAKLLGGKLSFFQSVSLLGYCTAPLVIAAVFCYLISNALLRSMAVLLALAWSTRASIVFMAGLVDPSKRLLAVYPCVLYFLLLAWMVGIQ